MRVSHRPSCPLDEAATTQHLRRSGRCGGVHLRRSGNILKGGVVAVDRQETRHVQGVAALGFDATDERTRSRARQGPNGALWIESPLAGGAGYGGAGEDPNRLDKVEGA